MARKRRPPRGAKGSPAARAAAPASLTPKANKAIWARARYVNREIPRLLHKHRAMVPADKQWDIGDRARALRALIGQGRKTVNYRTLSASIDAVDAAANPVLGVFRKSSTRQYTESIAGALLIALFIRAFLFEAYRIPSGSMMPTLMVGDFLFVSKFVYGVNIPFTDIQFLTWRDPAPGEVVIFEHPGPSQDKQILIKRIVAVAGDTVRMEDNVVYVGDEPLGDPRVVHREHPCFLQPEEKCHWVGTSQGAPPSPRKGCPCTFVAEHVGSFTWTTQHTSPNVGCVCEGPDEDGRLRTRELFNYPDWPGPWPTLFAEEQIWLPGVMEFPTRDFLDGWVGGKDALVDLGDGRYQLTVPDGHVLVMGDNRDNSEDGRFWGLVPVQNIKGKALFIWLANADLMTSRMFRMVH